MKTEVDGRVDKLNRFDKKGTTHFKTAKINFEMFEMKVEDMVFLSIYDTVDAV
jgi:hypothetical protein